MDEKGNFHETNIFQHESAGLFFKEIIRIRVTYAIKDRRSLREAENVIFFIIKWIAKNL